MIHLPNAESHFMRFPEFVMMNTWIGQRPSVFIDGLWGMLKKHFILFFFRSNQIGKLHLACYLKLFIDILHMIVHGLGGNKKFLCDLFIGKTVQNQFNHFCFLVGNAVFIDKIFG